MGNFWIVVALIVLISIVLFVFVALFSRFYIKAPPGTAIVVTGLGGIQATTGGGIMCYPILHQFQFIHAEAETIDFAGEKLVVQLVQEVEAILIAASTFGSKNREQTREILQALADSSQGDRGELERKLSKVGYQVL